MIKLYISSMIQNAINVRKSLFFFSVLCAFLYSSNSHSQSPDFNVQHLLNDAPRSATSTTSSFTEVVSLNNAFALNNNNRKASAGVSGDNGDLEGDDMAGATVLTGTNTLSFYRDSNSINDDTRFSSSIWQYVGPTGGANEMIVRGRYTVNLNGTTNSVTQAISGVSNANDCIPFITGIVNFANNNDADSGTAIAYLEDATTMRVQKGSTANNVTVYITLVEFTGSNWTVLHGDSGTTDSDTGSITLRTGSDGTGTATNVSDWSESIIFTQHRGDLTNGVNAAISDNWPMMEPGSDDQTVEWTFDGHHDSDGTNRHFVHVLNNSGLNVTRYSDTTNSANETTIDISSAGLSTTKEALIVGSSITSGTGTAYGRGWRNYYFISEFDAAHWSHRSGNTMAHEIQVIDLSGLTSASSFSEVTLSVDWPEYAYENTVEVYSPSGTLLQTITSGGASTYNPTISLGCLENLSDYEIVMYDTGSGFGDGWDGADNITVSIDGRDVINSSDNNSVDSFGESIFFDVYGGSCGPEINITGTGGNNVLSGSAATATNGTDFGNVNVSGGTNTTTFTIENLGSTDLILNGGSTPFVSISGDPDFTITSTPTSPITASGATTFIVEFDPSATGLRTATLTINNNDSTDSEDPYTINLQGTGIVPQPEINVTGTGGNNVLDGSAANVTNGTDFGNVIISGGTNTTTFTIENLGLADLILNGGSAPFITISGDSDFTITSTPSSPITASGSTTFSIEFAPVTTGLKTATLTINNNDSTGSEDPYTINLQGTGIVPPPEINVTGTGGNNVLSGSAATATNGTDFGTVDISGGTNSTTFTIENLGGSDLVLNGGSSPFISISGDPDFTITTTPSSPITASGSTTFIIQFEPTTEGLKTATLTINNNDPDGSEDPYEINLEGTGEFVLNAGPGGVTDDLELWLKSTEGLGLDDGDPVSVWGHRGRAVNATAPAGLEPTYRDNATRNINFNPVIDFVNDTDTATEDYTYSDTDRNTLVGTEGFFTQDIFLVVMPNDTINSTISSIDIFCGDSDEGDDERDGSGIGFGKYSIRVDDEVLTFALATTATDPSTPVANRGYGIAHTSTTDTYSNVGIINSKNNNASSPTANILYYNAVDVGNTEVGLPQFANISDSRFFIGRSEAYKGSFDGRICEIITYSAKKTDADLTEERNRIQSYLAIKYGITLGVNGTSQDYVNSAGSLIWDQNTGTAANDVFNHDITGIGRDDDSKLIQKQSKTVNTEDDITIGLGSIDATNSANSNTFSTDKSFLVWGNNDGTLAAQPAVSVNMSSGIGGLDTEVEFQSFDRVWKVVETGTVSTTKISIPSSMLTPTLPTPGGYLMFISDSPTFSPTSEYRNMTFNAGNYETDYDFDGTKYITFGYAPETTFVRSIYFDGTNDYLDAGDNMDLTGAFTISSWIKRDAGATDMEIVAKRDGVPLTEGYSLRIDNSGAVRMIWKDAASANQIVFSTTVIPEDEWHHVAVTYDGTDAKIYIDGMLSVTTALNPPVATDQRFLIGARNYTSLERFFQGNIDEVRVWDVALTDDQLRYVMNQEILDNSSMADGKVVPTAISKNDINAIPWSNLQGYYPMSTYTFTNAKDESDNGYTAALFNLTTVDYQTAPLPYVSENDGDWTDNATWLNGTLQTIPGDVSIVDNSKTIDWNIVEIENVVEMDNSSLPSSLLGDDNRTLLALDIKQDTLNVQGDNELGTGNGLTISHYLKLDGVLDLEGESQLIQTEESDLDVTSTGHIERDQQGTANSFTYNYFSSPVSRINTTNNNVDFNVDEVMKNGTNPNAPTDITFCPNPYCADNATVNTSSYWLYKFVNSGNAYANWQHIGSNTNKLKVTEGYSMKGSTLDTIGARQNYTYIGKPNNVLNGDTEIVHTTFPATFDGNGSPFLSLAGNPFASAIDADLFIDDNTAPGTDATTGTLYFWEHWGGGTHNWQEYQGGYATYTKAGGVKATSHPDVNQTGSGSKEPGQYIPVGQGFYVIQNYEYDLDSDGLSDSVDPDIDGDGVLNGVDNCPREPNPLQEDADSNGVGDVCEGSPTSSSLTPTIINPSSGDVVFKNSQRVFQKESGNVESVFTRTANSNQSTTNSGKQRIWLGFDTNEGYHRQLLAAFVDGATDTYDRGYDGRASDFMTNDLFFIQDDLHYVIQAFGEYNVDREIPLSVFIDEDSAGQTQTIKIDRLENISEDIGIFIKDNVTGETHDIRNQNFEFSLASGEHKDKYSLVFRAQSLSVEEEMIDSGFKVYMNTSTSTINISKTVDVEVTNVKLYNYLGQPIQTWNENLEGNEMSLPVHRVSTGAYILKIETNNKTISKKLIIE